VNDWLAAAEQRVLEDPARIAVLFPAVGRNVGRGQPEDAGRARLLAALPLRGPRLTAEVELLYRHGDAAERRGVLRALHLLEGIGAEALPLVEDALRSNDVRLIEAAVQDYGAARLGDHAWRHAVVKCVFVGVPLDRVARLDERADTELAQMLLDLAHERVAAGRAVPADVWRVVDRFPALLASAAIWCELESDVPERRAAAAAALADRPPPTPTPGRTPAERQR